MLWVQAGQLPFGIARRKKKRKNKPVFTEALQKWRSYHGDIYLKVYIFWEPLQTSWIYQCFVCAVTETTAWELSEQHMGFQGPVLPEEHSFLFTVVFLFIWKSVAGPPPGSSCGTGRLEGPYPLSPNSDGGTRKLWECREAMVRVNVSHIFETFPSFSWIADKTSIPERTDRN